MQCVSRKSIVAAAALALAAPALRATPAVSLSGDRLCVSVPDSDAGSRLTLLWDDADRGDDPAAWAHNHVITSGAAADGRYVVDLFSLGITNGWQGSLAVATMKYKLLDMLEMPDETSWIDTGFKDTEVFGVRFGFYGNGGKNSQWNYIIGSDEGSSDDARGFVVGQNNTNFGSWYWTYRGHRSGNDRPGVSTSSINEAAFTNQVFTLNGATVLSGLAAGSVGALDKTIYLGRIGTDYNARRHYGWWSHVSFDGENGERILDYIPAQRFSDGKVGFYDRATGEFVASSSTGSLNAGTVTNEWFLGGGSILRAARNFGNEIALSLNGSRLRINVPAAFAGESLLLVWDDSNKGDDIAAWANTNVLAETIGASGGTWNVNLSNIGVRDRQIFAVVAAHRLQLLDMLKMTSKQTYIDTGVKDSDCYGVRFGFYGNENSPDNNGTFSNFIGTYDKDFQNNPNRGTGFTIGMNNAKFDSWYWNYRTEKPSTRPSVSTTSINDVAFTNQVFMLNGAVVMSGLEAGPVGESGVNMYVGTWAPKSRFLYGWWSYVRFDDANGNAILDYVPAVRIADNKVGFLDRATMKFVGSTGNGTFTSGTVTNAAFSVVHSRQTFVKTDNPTVMTIR